MEEKLNKVPEWVKPEMIMGESWVVVDGTRYQFHIMDKKLEPRVPGFVGFPDGEFLFISEEVPMEYRPFILAHEVRENTVFKGRPGRCELALVIELGDVPSGMLSEYLKYRLNFFRLLLDYYKDRSDQADLQSELAKSYKVLQDTATERNEAMFA